MKVTYADFLAGLSENQIGVIEYLDQQFRSVEGVTRKIRYRVPFYDYGSWVCYLNPQKKDCLDLCFMRGKDIVKIYSDLEIKGRKTVGSYRIDCSQDIDIKQLMQVFRFALTLEKINS